MSNINEEMIENISIKKIIDLIYNLLNQYGVDKIDLFKLKDELPPSIINKLHVHLIESLVFIEYNGQDIPQKSKIFEFEDINGKKEFYRIYTEEFFNSIVNKYKIKNILIIANGIIREDFDFQKCLNDCNIEQFKVVEKKEIDYKIIFTQDSDEKDKCKKTWNKLSVNYNYYFENPKGEEILDFNYSNERTDLINSLFENIESILCYCGPHGIGKTITFLEYKRLKKKVCYFNLKIIFKNQSNPHIWKNELLLKELADAFKYVSNYEKFNELKQKLIPENKIWDSIYLIFDFMAQEEIEIQFILDQYQEKLDNNYENIKRIIELIKKNQNILSVILLSSINDKDVRLSLIDFWFNETKSNSLLKYRYLATLFDMKSIIDKDTSLNKVKKDMIINDFNCIPKYYYKIKNIEQENLNNFKNNEIQHIKEKFEEFFNDNPLNFEGIILLVKHNYQFGLNGEFDKKTFENITKIIIFKYFIIDNKTYYINYYFPLIEDIFKNILSDKSLSHLQMPVSVLKPSVVGDLLEYNLTYDLSRNLFCEFNYVCKVDSIYSLKICSYSRFENINESQILILQSNPSAKYIDFGIINKGEDLMLFQCKKALIKEPKNYVKYEDIFNDKKYLAESFHKQFGIKIKNIYLLYITGISFYKEGHSKKPLTWGINKKEDFEILIKMCKNSQAELLYYNVKDKIIYRKIEDNYISIGNIIEYVKNLRFYISIDENIEKSNVETNQLIVNFTSNKVHIDLITNLKNSNKNEEFFSENEKELLKINNYLNNFSIVKKIKNPSDLELNIPVFIGFKRKGKKYLSFYENNKKKKIIEISNNSIKEIQNYYKLFENPIDECFYFQDKKEN